jgi:hypothetical protein
MPRRARCIFFFFGFFECCVKVYLHM